jgi:ADP-ribosylglycohydrolase
MTVAVAEALLAVGSSATVEEIEETLVSAMRDWGQRYPYAGYGGKFRHWLREKNPKPYGSYGNGSAMRVSPAGWLYDSIERTREVARATANVSHNHPEGIKGAEATASAIYLARNGATKEEIKEYVEREFHYDLNRTLDEIRPYYHMDETCQKTVPEAIIAFLEAEDFEDAVRNAVSLGGDTDTLGAITGSITGSIAEAYFGIPAILIGECRARIDAGLMTDVIDEFDYVLGRKNGEKCRRDPGLTGNGAIEAAINQFYIQNDKDGMLLFMEVLISRMQSDGDFAVPYISDVPLMTEEQACKAQIGQSFSIENDIRLKMETVTDENGIEWMGVFTSSKELHKGSAGHIQINQSIKDMLKLALDWDKVNGIVINPFGQFARLSKELIQMVLDGYSFYEKEQMGGANDGENN